MRNITKKMLSMVAAVAMAVTLVAPTVTVDAKKKSNAKSASLFVGEEMTLYPIGSTLKKVTSSKKKVVKVKKKNGSALLQAKKAGKSKVTLKTNKGNTVYNVTVSKNPFKVSATPIAGDKLLVTVQNTSKSYFGYVDVQVTLCDAAGNPVNQKNTSVSRLGSKQTAYAYVNAYDEGVDLSQTKCAVKEWRRNPSYKYTNYAKKVNVSVVESTSASGRQEIKLRASCNYSGKGWIYIAQEIFCYDAMGQVVGVIEQSCSLYKDKTVYTDSVGSYLPDGTASYKVESKRVWLETN